jgi:hypothetical protein
LISPDATAQVAGFDVVPVDFSNGWVDASGSLVVSNTSTPTLDVQIHNNVAAAWSATANRYATIRVYLTMTSTSHWGAGAVGNDVGEIVFMQFNTDSGAGFFNWATPNHAASPGPQPYIVNNIAQGQRAFDSYLTVGGAHAGADNGVFAEGKPGGAFNALRGVSPAVSPYVGGLGGATNVNFDNCGYYSLGPTYPIEYDYGSGHSGIGLLVGQFTVLAGDTINGHFAGLGPVQLSVFDFSYSTAVPAPAGMAILALAGACTHSRRRRNGATNVAEVRS